MAHRQDSVPSRDYGLPIAILAGRASRLHEGRIGRWNRSWEQLDGYVIHQAPGLMMAVQATTEMAKQNSRQRIDPLIEESQVLRELVSDPLSCGSGNTVLSKEFPGGILVMTGANSAVGLRSIAARFLFLDEVDAYPGDVDGEGDPINLAAVRTRTFSRHKVYLVSTPSITGLSRIESSFEESDQRRYWVPCPSCGEFQTLKRAQLAWPKGRPEDNSLQVTWHRISYSVAEVGYTDRLVTVSVDCQPQYDSTNGTAVAKCNVEDHPSGRCRQGRD